MPHHEEEQPIKEDQQVVPNSIVPTTAQNDLAEIEQNVNQVTNTCFHNCSYKRICAQTMKTSKSHALDEIISDLNKGIQTRSQMRNFCANSAFLSILGPKNNDNALRDSEWFAAM